MASVLAFGLWCHPAQAQLATIDIANLEQQARDFLQFLKAYALQGQQYIAEANTLRTEILQLESFVQNPAANIGNLLNVAGLNSALPISPQSVQSLVSGRSQGGALGFLSLLQNISFTSNNVYTCRDASWSCQNSLERAQGISATQGIAMNNMQVIQSHQIVLQGLRNEFATATEPAKRENLMLAIQSESTFIQMESSRIQAAGVLSTAQRDSWEQQNREKNAQQLQTFIDNIR